jgi:hypothetical protein
MARLSMSESPGACLCWTNYMGAQVERLRCCIDENKWYLSQKAGYDVGHGVAEVDFVHNHADRVAAEFRLDFCRWRCVRRAACRIAAMLDDVNRPWTDGDVRRRLECRALSTSLTDARIMVVLPEMTPAPAAPTSDPNKAAEQPPQGSQAQP